MSWLFSQALVEEYLGDISSDGEPSVQLSGNPTQQAYCSPDKMTECSRLSRSGMMFKPLTEDRGEALLMSYREAFLVRTSQLLGGEQESRESEAECGKKWHGSFVKYDLRFVFVENSPMLTSRGLGTVLGDLASLGFDAKWGVLGAADVGAPHQRDRIWIVAHASSIDGWDVLRGQLGESQESKSRNCGVDMAYPKNKRRQKDMGNARQAQRFPSRNDGIVERYQH
jgi:hypothetical protein